MTKCSKCGNQHAHLRNEVSSSPYIRPRLVCVGGCKPYDRTEQILKEIAEKIDDGELRLTEKACQALADVNAAIARQDRRLGNGK